MKYKVTYFIKVTEEVEAVNKRQAKEFILNKSLKDVHINTPTSVFVYQPKKIKETNVK